MQEHTRNSGIIATLWRNSGNAALFISCRNRVIFARNLKRRSSPKETVIVLYYYSREQMLANEENSNQRHLVMIACEALLMTMVLSALCKHIHAHTYTHAHTHKQTHTNTQAHTCTQRHTHKDTHKHIYTIKFIYRMKCLTFYSLKIWKTYTHCVCEFKKQSILKNYHSKCIF